MFKLKDNKIYISVRNLVEFIFREGDLDSRRIHSSENAMQAGSKVHKQIQKTAGSNYRAEVDLYGEYEEKDVKICIDGRADGIIYEEDGITIDEIKCTYADVTKFEEPVGVHLAQAMCYAYIYLKQKELSGISVQLTYVGLEKAEMKKFLKHYNKEELESWFDKLIHEFGMWANFMYHHKLERNASIKELPFPFEYRKGQKELVIYTYRTISRGKKMFVQAPTGIGKTMSMLYPSIKAMGEDEAEKIFYLTAKTITRTVAEEGFKILGENGLDMLSLTITAKEKVCILDKPECNPEACKYAKGHFDRINEAIFYAINNYKEIGREEVLELAEKFNVCPFELSLDISSFCDSVICDYNYVFDPNVRLKRYFADSNRGNYVFLVDEAHNLVERARKMYSAALIKEDFLAVDRLVKAHSKKLHNRLYACNRTMLELKRDCEGLTVLCSLSKLSLKLEDLFDEMNNFSEDNPTVAAEEIYRELYFNVRHFLNMYDAFDENYKIYSQVLSSGDFLVKLLCIDPSVKLSECTMQGRAAVFFSATLLPMKYYCEMLSCNDDDYKVYVDSPFDTDKRLLLLANDVSGRYKRRTRSEYMKVVQYISSVVSGHAGNYMVFFPSYQYMNTILELADELGSFEQFEVFAQKNDMDEEMREEFLSNFINADDKKKSVIGMCVLGGIFSEGIDLKGESLIGVFVIGTGIGQISSESDLISRFFEERGENGFDMTYMYPGLNRVLQAAGRVIRTESDEGVIALLDDRFTRREYIELFPKEWGDYVITDLNRVEDCTNEFWVRRLE